MKQLLDAIVAWIEAATDAIRLHLEHDRVEEWAEGYADGYEYRKNDTLIRLNNAGLHPTTLKRVKEVIK